MLSSKTSGRRKKEKSASDNALSRVFEDNMNKSVAAISYWIAS